jgi:hypothetical protein
MFEWGCGGSTLYYSKYVTLYRSIEHEIGWYNKVCCQTPFNVELYHVEMSNDYQQYIDAIDQFEDTYDAILVDGRQRVKCVEKCTKYVNKNGFIFVHDYFKRPKYHSIQNIPNLILIDSIKNTPQTLAVFQKK